MLKRIVAVLLCAVFISALMPIANITDTAFASDYNFDERIMYGGVAVDVGTDVIYNENGALYRKNSDGEVEKIAEVDGKYLNYYKNKLFFVNGNKIMSCSPDGSRMVTVCEFKTEIKCLYVGDFGMMYLKNDTVFVNENGVEKTVLTRDGIEGFFPEQSGEIRWIKKNPNYVYVENNGDEGFVDGNDEYLQYRSVPNSEMDCDVLALYGTELAEETITPDYFGPYVKVGETTLPLEEHMPGTYFSKNGQACTCHNIPGTYCIESVGSCNCMRYYPTGIKATCEVDLLGAQCFAFARMIFWKCFGFIDHTMNSGLYYNVGTLKSGGVTANTVKELLMKAAPGAHVRLAAGHSVSILSMDEDFIVIYHGNAGGDGVQSAPCIVSTRRYTWAQFATAAVRGIQYVNMPYNYPDSEIILTKKETGFYRLAESLNLRAEANTETESLAVINKGTVIEVTEIDGYWGKTEYNGKIGWVFLQYTAFFSRKEIAPSGDVFYIDGSGYLKAKSWKMTFDSFSEHFNKQNLKVKSASGKDLMTSGYIGTGSVVTIEVNGNTIDKATVCLAGDVNCNGSLDVGDYIMIKRSCMKTYNLNPVQTVAADVYGNDGIDSLDYLMVRRYFFTPNVELFSSF